MQNYNDLSPKGKFIRSCICVPIFWLMTWGLWAFVKAHFILSTGFVIKYAVAALVIAVVGIYQLVSTYKAYKNDKDGYGY